MSYKLYTDKNENFECEVAVKNASLKGSIARLIVESDGLTLAFNGKIVGDKCVIPVKRLRGLMDENVRGNMHLEVIVEDTYFKPWESDFVVEEHTSVKVKINEQKQTSNKPVVEIKSKPVNKILPVKKVNLNMGVPLKEISMICEMFGVKKKNLKRNKRNFVNILKEYFLANPEYKKHQRTILRGLPSFMR